MDDGCVSYKNNDLVLIASCKLSLYVWKSTKGQINKFALKNYYGGKYPNFVSENPVPQMISELTRNSRFNFQVQHYRNNRFPNNRSYWGVTHHIIRNTASQFWSMVIGNVMRKLNCKPSKPEHLNLEKFLSILP